MYIIIWEYKVWLSLLKRIYRYLKFLRWETYSPLIKGTHRVCFVLKLSKELLLLFKILIILGKDIYFLRYLQNWKQTGLWVIYLRIKYQIKMRPQRLIHEINKPVLNLYFRFEFFIRKLYLCVHHLIIIRIKCILMIDIYTKMLKILDIYRY